MNVLMVDVGGTNVKVMACYEGEMRKMSSGEKLTASEMVRGVAMPPRSASLARRYTRPDGLAPC